MIKFWEDKKIEFDENQISVDATLVLVLQLLTYEDAGASDLKETSETTISNYKNGMLDIIRSIKVSVFYFFFKYIFEIFKILEILWNYGRIL
jgi:hypothetical protein